MNVFELFAKLSLDSSGYESGMSEAETKAEGFGSKLKNVLGVVGKASVAAIGAVSTTAVAVGKQAISAYADFEQLSGGIETLYTNAEGGTKAVETMLANASNAWKTAGMSANDYMSMAIESSASLINALGGDVDKASEMMDQAIIDMSDNVNKMGTSMEGVQNAYRGFSRGNFSMLDNLALGFAGTKEGMQELLDKASEFAAKNGEVRDFSIDSYADIVDAIHIVQTEMGITGTTAEEAAGTISGSVNAMKAAWQNMLVAIADENADFDTKVDDFIESVLAVGENIIPRVQVLLKGLSKLITEAADKLLPVVVDTIIQNLPSLIESGVKLVVALITGLFNAIPQLVHSIPQILKAIIDGFKAGWPDLKKAGIDLIESLILGILQLNFKVGETIDKLIDVIREKIRGSIDAALNWGRDLISNFIDGIKNGWSELKGALGDFAQKVADFIGFSEPKEGPLSKFHTFAPDMMKLFAEGIKDNENVVTAQIEKSFNFGPQVRGAAPALASGPTTTTNTWNITVTGIDELEEVVRWFKGRKVEERMA